MAPALHLSQLIQANFEHVIQVQAKLVRERLGAIDRLTNEFEIHDCLHFLSMVAEFLLFAKCDFFLERLGEITILTSQHAMAVDLLEEWR